jgi:hypothetical protein
MYSCTHTDLMISIPNTVEKSNLLYDLLYISSFFCRCFRWIIYFLAFSKFGDIFDEDHFVESLRKYVRVVKELPEDIFLRFDYNISMIPNMRTKAFSPPGYYLQQVLPKLLELGCVLPSLLCL